VEVLRKEVQINGAGWLGVLSELVKGIKLGTQHAGRTKSRRSNQIKMYDAAVAHIINQCEFYHKQNLKKNK
jgi:hypothetical protein